MKSYLYLLINSLVQQVKVTFYKSISRNESDVNVIILLIMKYMMD